MEGPDRFVWIKEVVYRRGVSEFSEVQKSVTEGFGKLLRVNIQSGDGSFLVLNYLPSDEV